MSGIDLELRRKIRAEGKFKDDFTEKFGYWEWRIDNFAGFTVENSVLRLWMGPSEALYYSNAEISDGSFDDLPWSFKNLEVKARLEGKHYGSAGFGFWNHTMVIDRCVPIWFIYLRARGKYPLQGFFIQVANVFIPIKLFEGSRLFRTVYYLSKISARLTGIKVLTPKPVMQDLDLSKWHTYRIEWDKEVKFYIDGELVGRIPFVWGNVKARVDAWIDNAVYEVRKGDPGFVYRHATQENRYRTWLDIDYISLW